MLSRVVRRDGQLCVAGVGSRDHQAYESSSLFAEATNGEILMVQDEDHPLADGQSRRQPGKLLVKYASMRSLKAREPLRSWPLGSVAVEEMAAFDAGFVILYRDGTVATMGDARFADCLGRQPSPESYVRTRRTSQETGRTD